MRKVFFLSITMLFAFSAAVYSAVEKPVHPVDMQGYLCVDCHEPSSTLENKSESNAYKEWLQSTHGVNNVNCTTCHGSEDDFRPVSSVNDCLSCHATETAVINRKTDSKDSIVCVSCHTAHSFSITIEKKPVHTPSK